MNIGLRTAFKVEIKINQFGPNGNWSWNAAEKTIPEKGTISASNGQTVWKYGFKSKLN